MRVEIEKLLMQRELQNYKMSLQEIITYVIHITELEKCADIKTSPLAILITTAPASTNDFKPTQYQHSRCPKEGKTICFYCNKIGHT